jgi:DNA-binding transcriptional LysR family regulator
MQLQALEVFCEVARHRSFSQAAATQGISQSAASQIVLMLERDILGVQLIDRSTRPLQLTELGKTYYEGCKQLLEQYHELEASIRQAQAQVDATVQVAAIYSVGLSDMGHYIERFERQQPGVKVQVEYLHPDRVYEKVLDRSADFGLVSFPRRSRELVVWPWRDEEMVLACAPSHPLARQRHVKPEQLRGEKYIGFDRDLVIRKEVDRFLREHEVPVQVVMEFDNIENIKKAVEISAGVALLPEPTTRYEVAAGTLTALPLVGARLVRPLGVIHSRHHKLNTTILRFIELLRQGDESAQAADTNGASNGRTESARQHGGKRRRQTSAGSRGKD